MFMLLLPHSANTFRICRFWGGTVANVKSYQFTSISAKEVGGRLCAGVAAAPGCKRCAHIIHLYSRASAHAPVRLFIPVLITPIHTYICIISDSSEATNLGNLRWLATFLLFMADVCAQVQSND